MRVKRDRASGTGADRRVLALVGVFASASFAVTMLWLARLDSLPSHLRLRWWVLSVGFALCEIFVIHLDRDRQTHTFSLMEVPLVVGLYLVSPGWARPPVWLHGDLHPANVLTENGNFCGIVDFGDLCAGDPALDLAACWILLPDDEGVRRFQRAYGLTADTATWRRARGWAVWRAVGSLLIADAGRRGRPGGKSTWGPPALDSLRLLTGAVV